MRIFILIASLSMSYATFAQRVTGRVLDDFGAGLAGATVLEKGTTNGAATDLEGLFSLELKDAKTAILVVRSIGFDEKEIEVAGRSEVEIRLGENTAMLDQVVVVGYGVQQKSDLTGAVSTLKSKEIERVPTSSIEQALQGKIAGVYVQPASGEPGAGAIIRIRGTGSLNNSAPIFVVDGMIVSDASFVNPQDVASMEVLKDASACAIYGARGANGVIIITTKSGKKSSGDGQISFSTFFGNQQPTRFIEMANGAEFARLYNQFRGQDFYKNPDAFGTGTDWQREVFRSDAPQKSYQLSITGGSERHSFGVSGNFFSQDGILKNSHFDRISGRFNNEYRVKSWFSVGSSLSLTKTRSDNAPGGVIESAYRMPSIFAPRDSNGKWSDPTFFGLAISNPAATLFYQSNNHGEGFRSVGNVFGDVRFLKNFTFRSNFGFDIGQSKGRYFEPIFKVSGSQLNKNDRLDASLGKSQNWIWEQTLTFQKEFSSKHKLNILAGYTAEERTNEWFGASRQNFPGTADELLFLSAGNDTTQTNYGGASDEALVSYLFRANYGFKSRYLLTFSMRADQSSRFQAANRTGYFPAVGLGWVVSNEPFFEKMVGKTGVLDRLKLRVSHGKLGNQNTNGNISKLTDLLDRGVIDRLNAAGGVYPTVAAVTSGLYGVFGPTEDLNFGATLLAISNPNLRWESTLQTDAGAEIGLFKNRLELEVDWYRRRTFDIIAAVPIPDFVGSASNPVVNTAEVENRGWDMTANLRERFRGLNWSVGGTFSPVKNEVLKLAAGKEEILAAFLQGEPATRTATGLPIGSFFGYRVAGVFQDENEVATLPKIGVEKAGDLRFEDLDGDGKITPKDRAFLGSPIPKMTFGLNAGLEFFGFDVAADLFGVRGNKVYNAKKTFRFGVYNWEKSAVAGWTKDAPSTTEPRTTSGGHNYRVSSYFLEDGSFTRLRSLVLGYSLPKTWLSKAHFSKFRVYGNLTNWVTWQKYGGYSPEFGNGSNPYEVGFDFGGYPVARSWQIGAEVGF